MSYHDIVKDLIKKRAKAETGVYETRQKEIATERATKEKFRRQNKEAEIGEEMFEDGTYEPLGERISTSKARASLRVLAQSLLKLLAKRGTMERALGRSGIVKQMLDVVKDARVTPKLRTEIQQLGGDIIKLLNSEASFHITDANRESLKDAMTWMSDSASMDRLYRLKTERTGYERPSVRTESAVKNIVLDKAMQQNAQVRRDNKALQKARRHEANAKQKKSRPARAVRRMRAVNRRVSQPTVMLPLDRLLENIGYDGESSEGEEVAGAAAAAVAAEPQPMSAADRAAALGVQGKSRRKPLGQGRSRRQTRGRAESRRPARPERTPLERRLVATFHKKQAAYQQAIQEYGDFSREANEASDALAAARADLETPNYDSDL